MLDGSVACKDENPTNKKVRKTCRIVECNVRFFTGKESMMKHAKLREKYTRGLPDSDRVQIAFRRK